MLSTSDDNIRDRISGRSVRATATAGGIALADVSRALNLFTEATFNDNFESTRWPSSEPDSMSGKKSSTLAPCNATCRARIAREDHRTPVRDSRAPYTTNGVVQIVEAQAPQEP